MTAAELLRGLDERATGGPWDYETFRNGDGLMHEIAPVKNALGQLDWSREVACTADDNVANARLIATTRNLLPLLAGLVEAVAAARDAEVKILGFPEQSPRDEARAFERANKARVMAFRALDALNAAAAKEVK